MERFFQESGVILQSWLIQEIRGPVVSLQEAANLADDFRVACTQTCQPGVPFSLGQEPAHLEEIVDALPLLLIHDGVS
jgi:hypothetical protein